MSGAAAGSGEPEAEQAQLRERLAAERDERRRLAELIHDGPVQHLAAIAQMLEAARQALGAGDWSAAEAVLTRTLEVTREASHDLRDVVSGLEPEALHAEGFASAVHELTERVAVRRGIAVELELGPSDGLGANARSGLYQIVREALDQAVRRGPPSRVAIRLADTPGGGVELTITDDGARERREAVVHGFAERAAELNATFSAELDDAGTTIRVTLPPTATRL